MLRAIAKALFVSRTWILSIAFLAAVWAVVESSQPFQACVKEIYYNPATENFEKSIPSFSVAFDIYRSCLGHFTHDNAEAIIAAFTILLAFSTIFLWVATRDLVKSANKTAERQLRAYLLIDGGSIVPITTNDGRVFISADIQSKNFGQTPAYHFRSWQRIEIFDSNAIPVYEQGDGIGASDVGPSGERNVTLSRGPVSAPDIVAIKNGSKTVRIWGQYDYIDIFDRPRYLKFFLKNGKELKSGGWPIEPAEKRHEGN